MEIGMFVKSNHGRDKGNVYIVQKIDKKYVLLVDGNNKTVDKPKKKNIKHIDKLNVVSEKLAEKFKQNKNVFDAEVYSAIKKFKE